MTLKRSAITPGLGLVFLRSLVWSSGDWSLVVSSKVFLSCMKRNAGVISRERTALLTTAFTKPRLNSHTNSVFTNSRKPLRMLSGVTI